MSNPRLTRSVEDYLKAIYLLSERGAPASTSDIAELLEVQPASVSGMIKRLAESDFLEHSPYRGVRLTEEGTREALRIVRRHRVIETYLHVRLGYSWEEVHTEAERLEHAASDDLVDRMAASLENPSHDPHGAPIPTRAGEIEDAVRTTLAEASVGAVVVIQGVQDEDPDRLRYMEARGLLPGVRLALHDRQPFDGPITVLVGGSSGTPQVLGHELATRIYVVPSRTS
jgi:DtxR family Mn-dependent transcriptional regulator